MEKIISCHVIEDLMPSYADDICSKESKRLVEEHIVLCDSCKEKLDRMQSDRLELGKEKIEEADIISLTNRLKEREKKHKRNTGMLGALSGVLALCLVVSVFAGSRMNIIQPTPGNGQVASSDTAAPETEEGMLLGIASEKELGDYRVAKDYSEIYKYFRNIYKEREGGLFSNITGAVLYKEEASASTEDAASDSAASAAGAVTNGTMDMGAGAVEFSSTNIMTTGVDESDISKTDGNYIYNATGSEIIIFDITNGEASQVAKLVPDFASPSDLIREIYVDGDKLSVIIEHEDYSNDEGKSQTFVSVYDISDVENAKLKGNYKQDGRYKTSRKTEDIIYLFTEEWIKDPGKSTFAEEDVSDWFPTINDKKISSDCIYLPQTGENTLVMSSFNQNQPQKTIDTKVIVNQYAQVYVGSDSIFLYSNSYGSGREITKISRLGYDKGHITAGASTSIRGNINDAFAINEYDGYLRVVSTEWNDSLSNMLYVFDKNLKECGRINNIANGESLYACRFMGDKGYFVTFEQTDPLFSVDLSDPNNPYLIGELELPGFSEYLHFWGEDKLLGIGYETNSKGERTGLKLSMFDITDPANMTEISKHVIDGGDYAPGFYNYKAILCAPNVNILGFSYVDYGEEGANARYMIYSYDDESSTFYNEAENLLKDAQIDRVRGHFRGEYLYISKDTQVESVKWR